MALQVANYAWDMTMYSFTCCITVALFRGFKLDAFTDNGAFIPIFVLLYGFGLCVTGFTYCLSYLFSSHTRGQVITVVLNLLPFGMVLTILSSILSFISPTTANVNEMLQPLYRVFPLFALPEALYAVTIQYALPWEFTRETRPPL